MSFLLCYGGSDLPWCEYFNLDRWLVTLDRRRACLLVHESEIYT